MRPMANDLVEAGESSLRRARSGGSGARSADGNRGNMLRAVAFARADGPARWGFDDAVLL